MSNVNLDEKEKEIWNEIFQKLKLLKEITGKDYIVIEGTSMNIKSNNSNQPHTNPSEISRKSLNLPLAKTPESHGVRRLRRKNRTVFHKRFW